MTKITSGLICSIILISMVGCSSMSKQDVGVLTGGAIGGALGSQFGSGSGKILAAVGGTLVGAFLGGAIGKNMDETDRLKMNQALETCGSGRTVTWRNPDSGREYYVTPSKPYYRGSQPCREYTTRAIIGGKTQEVYGTACRMNDGSWKVAS